MQELLTLRKFGSRLQGHPHRDFLPMLETRKNVGCDFVKWLEVEPETLDEKCPKCGSPLTLIVTRFGKKMKKCSTNQWDKDTKKASGCDFVEWINGTTEPLDEDCPTCGNKLVLYTTANTGSRLAPMNISYPCA
jgi:ssDNA-binding Zn-finger/Zn-ribbon topoisomerase 1